MKRLLLLLVLLNHCVGSLLAADYNVLNFGAMPGKLSTVAIQKAVDQCHAAGGGRVVVPPGTFITGCIVLKSNVNLHLEPGAEMLGSENMEDYRVQDVRRGMIFCEDAINVSISGSGTINGNGTHFYETDKNHVYEEFDKSRTRQKENYMPEGTFFTDGPLKRKAMPGMTIVFFHCNKVSVTGITIKDTPIWATRFGYCDGVMIDGITILNNILVPNSDGIHTTVSRNISISNCNIFAGDDAIVVTGFPKDEETPTFNSADQDAHRYGNKTIYAENVTVTNCQLKSSSAGIRIGYGQHPIRRCTFSNIVIYDSHRGIGIFAHDANNIEDLIFTDIIIETRLRNGQWWGHGEPIHLSCISRFEGRAAGQIKNVQFNNINAIGEQGILLFGQEESPMENIQFNNVQLRMRKGKETMAYGGNFDLRPATPKAMQIFEHDIPGIYAQHVNKLDIRDFNLSWGADLPSFFTHGIHCKDVTDLLIKGFIGSANPNAPGSEKVKLENAVLRKEY
ncbi:MAG TPA: glycosyl hydrolase family 28 protein [Prolixibacteraceae bacterium]|nr:glycosyl hydrolase family 28 protein [Prolixibacteraceae bacterium]